MASVYLGLGSNVGNQRMYINKAIKLLGGALKGIERAPYYTSKAVGYTDQSDFLNTVIRGNTEKTANELLVFVKLIEEQVGRIPRFRWGPREFDIDIIFYESLVMKTTELTIPHPLFNQRDFVLIPLLRLDSELIDPLSKQGVSSILAAIPASERSILQELDAND